MLLVAKMVLVKRTNNNICIINILRCCYRVMISYTGHLDQVEHELVEKTES